MRSLRPDSVLTLITGGEVYTPEPVGVKSVLLAFDRVARIGEADLSALQATGLPVQAIDASGCIVAPGLVDCHEHLIGGSGEEGFATLTPEVAFSELVAGGITTVVGCLGVDTTTRTMAALVAKVKGLREEGLSAFAYTGGYDVPPVTLTGSLRSDVLFVEEIIGVGEVAISDRRSTEPTTAELVRIVRAAYVAGMLSGKCGVTHFHVGDEPTRLAPIRALLDDYQVDAALLYPTHVERNESLMKEAVELSRRGVTVDVDVVARDLARWVRFFVDHGGELTRLTASSDAAINSPATLLEQIRSCVLQYGFTLEQMLPLVTSTPARVLKLHGKGRIAEGGDADVVIMRKDSLALVAVIAGGRVLMQEGQLRKRETYLARTNRRITLHGENATS